MKAISCFNKAIELNPNYKLAKFAKSTCFLHLRNFVQGWQYYEFREHEKYLDIGIVRSGQDVRYSINDSKLKGLGWSPQCDFNTELEEITKYYCDNFIW